MTDVPEGIFDLRLEKEGFSSGLLTDIAVVSGQTTTVSDQELSLSTGIEGVIIINQGAEFSQSLTADLSITASSNTALMMISENRYFTGLLWEAVMTDMTYTFDSYGEKTLYIKFADTNGLESPAYSDSINIINPLVTLFLSLNNKQHKTHPILV